MKRQIFLFSFMLFCFIANAQTDVYNNSQIFITNATDTFFITGSLFNNATAQLNNAGGNLFVKQNLTNDEINMTTGAGKLWTIGTALQTFYGSSPFKTHNWIVSNSSNVALQNRVELGNSTGGSLTFVNGKIISGSNLQDVFFNENSNYSGYGDASHVVGYCSKKGNTSFIFPIGNGLLKTDLDIDNLSTSSVFQCKYFGTGYSSLAVTAPLVSVFDKEYWTLDRISGTTGANITLKWNDARNPLNHSSPSSLRVGHFTGASWISEGGIGSGNTSTGSVSSIFVNSFGPFTFASAGLLLPILFNSFDVSSTANCAANIKWTAVEDGNTKKYYLQKLVANSWIYIDSILPKITSTATYSVIDDNTDEGNNLYRLVIENVNSSLQYTSIKSIRISCSRQDAHVYPTLAHDYITVRLPKTASVTVLNSSGQIMMQFPNVPMGNKVLNVSKLAAGAYIVCINTAYKNSNISFVKK